MQDKIEKSIELIAPIDRVWRALADYEEFGQWFRVKLDGPFKVGETTRGQITYPGYEHLKWVAMTTQMQPERLFAFRWWPGANGPDLAFEDETLSESQTQTLVEFRLEATPQGTRLEISESGFNNLPADRREEAYRENENGWEIQAQNIATYVET